MLRIAFASWNVPTRADQLHQRYGPYLYLTALVITALVQPFPDVDGTLGTVEELVLLGCASAHAGSGWPSGALAGGALGTVAGPPLALVIGLVWLRLRKNKGERSNEVRSDSNH